MTYTPSPTAPYLRILPDVYVVGSGTPGFGLSHDCDCHVYLIDGGDEIAIIDAGSGIKSEAVFDHIHNMLPYIQKVNYVFLTHGHADHAGGAVDFQSNYGSTIFLSAEESRLLAIGDEEALGLTMAKELGHYPRDYTLRKCSVDVEVNGGDTFTVGRYELRAIKTPGHSKGSISYLLTGHPKRVLFAGDVLFPGGLINLLNHPSSDLADYRTYTENLRGLDVDALLPGHRMFCLSQGQKHIDRCLHELTTLAIPRLTCFFM
jgi:glyoxylase-like metal-dependent hydrolase (beta-lactamase superfamily II)